MRFWLPAVVAACWSGEPPKPKPPVQPVAQTAPVVTRETCDRLLAHLIDLEFAKAGAGDASGKQAVVDAKGDEFAAACMKAPRARIDCALAAKTLAGVAECDRS